MAHNFDGANYFNEVNNKICRSHRTTLLERRLVEKILTNCKIKYPPSNADAYKTYILNKQVEQYYL